METGLTGDAFTGELKEATGNLAAQTSRMVAGGQAPRRFWRQDA